MNNPSPTRTTRIVGLGASAGGLQPLEEFLAHVPLASGLAYIVVQHLDPTRKTMLTELLQHATAMPVREARASMRIEPNAVYVIPPNAELTVMNDELRLAEPGGPRGMRLPIDVLFGSLARDRASRAIGVVLSGMGSDGTLGLQAIKAQGGLGVAQDPQTAQFDSMPKSAIAAGAADLIGAPAELPARILRVIGARRAVRSAAEDSREVAAGGLSVILDLLRAHNKHDLSLYKPSTLRRRIERRMAIHGIETMPRYAEFLQANAPEIDLLFKEMLIGVTSFFRDPEVWSELEATMLPELFAQREPGTPLRAWVAGCSTGEEAFSLAIALKEAADKLPGPRADPPQIFATDFNADAIAYARRAQYPATIAADVPPERLARYFHPHGDGYVVDPRIRERVLFAQHDLIMDPPFTRLDLLSCRNLLIYFTSTLQKRLLPLFHYSLRPGGILLLGGSETVGSAQGLFSMLSSKSRLYRRGIDAAALGAVDFPVSRRLAARSQSPELPMPHLPLAANLQSLADQVLLQKFSPPAVMVNELGDILYISGRTGKYLEPAAGKANWNVHVMARPFIRTQLAVALRRAVKERKPVEIRDLHMEGDATHRIDLVVEGISDPKALDGLMMIVFREYTSPPAGGARRKAGSGAALDSAIGAELVHSQEEIKSLREAMRAAEEERQAAIEELQSTNEELQSANEELTTSKEEAQSMNEELQTINSELQSKLDALALAQSDMQNLLNSTDIATLFLDKDLNVRRFTDQIKRIINVRETDIGRPLSDLTTTLNYPALHADAHTTLRTLAFSEKEISTTDARWYKVRIMPYRTIANVIQGAVITFVDITAAKVLEASLRSP